MSELLDPNLASLKKRIDQHSNNSNDYFTPPTEELEKLKPKPPKPKTLIDNLKEKQQLYRKLKKGYLNHIAKDIEKGKKTTPDIEKFVYDLLEEGLKTEA
jgi:hypothetical protein